LGRRVSSAEWGEASFAVGYEAGSDAAAEELRELAAEVHWLRRIETLVRDDLAMVETALGHPWSAMRDLLGE
jgi:hypothetical protein